MTANGNTSPRLDLPYILPGQAQKHVTHNTAISDLDSLVQLSVKSMQIAVRPITPTEGDAYIIPDTANQDWGYDPYSLMSFRDGAWHNYIPKTGWRVWDEDEMALHVFQETLWQKISPQETFDHVGIGAAADSVNRLSVSSSASLLSHDGSGHQLKINKAAASDTASVLFQSNFSGHAEFGLTGDNDWHVKVSSDGQNWAEALITNSQTGQVTFPQGVAHAESQASLSSFLPVAAGAGVNSIYRVNAAHSATPRQADISAVSGSMITLSTAVANSFFLSPDMEGVAYARIWNMSKTPPAPAWVKASSGGNMLEVTSAADISTWQSADTVQIGDPTDQTPGNVIALDISPMLSQQFGSIFPQKGLVAKLAVATTGADKAMISLSANGASGSFSNQMSFPDGSLNVGQAFVACSTPSPISNSNLVFVQENCVTPNAITISLASVLALYV